MSKIYNWETKKTKQTKLTKETISKYFFKEIRYVSDAKKIFKNSYFDFRNETIRIDQFSEIANRLWEILMKEKKEKNEIGYIVLMVSEINFYLDTNNMNRVDDILDEVRKYFDIN